MMPPAKPSSSRKSALPPILARVVSGAHGTRTPVREPLLRIIKVQGISMTAGPRENPDDETEPREGDTLYAYRIFLTDDVYIVGAVVDPCLHALVHDRVLMTGALVRLTDYDVKTSVKKFATGKFTRYLKVRDLIVQHSPSIRFIGDDDNKNPDMVNGITAAHYEDDDEMVVIKQEAPSQPSLSLPSSSRNLQADIRVDDRDRAGDANHRATTTGGDNVDPDERAYGLDDDDDDGLSQLVHDGDVDSGATTPDSYATADERPSSPDYTLDELDELTEEELAQWPAGRMEPKTVITEETIAATWRSSQKERVAEQKTRPAASSPPSSKKENAKPASREKGEASSMEQSSSAKAAGNPLKRSHDDSLPSSSPKSAKSTPFKSSPPQQNPMSTPIFTSSAPASTTTPTSTPPTPANTLTKLGDLYRKPLGSKVDVLAIIAACDDHTIKRSIGVKRDMHLLDPTAKRNVWLSVWVDADKFKPAVGACVLFRGLTVHRFDGRSLNAFKEVAGTEWHVVEPREDVAPGVDELKAWWHQRAIEETLKSFGEDDL
ncbi:hypothetical protein TWF696_008757 [Orbilia brochopaga]|uniref:Replication protein A OB domain-containing protein n=1 Tax=Orbilia brochopaga TaxID=3140254 RepID=A0AAV9UK00_9PEZI